MNSKMTTNSQPSTTEPKKWKQKQSKQLEQDRITDGDHVEGYEQGRGKNGGKTAGNKKHNW